MKILHQDLLDQLHAELTGPMRAGLSLQLDHSTENRIRRGTMWERIVYIPLAMQLAGRLYDYVRTS